MSPNDTPRARRMPVLSSVIATVLASGVLAGCGLDMADQPKAKPLAHSDFFADGRASRDPVDGTVARGHLRIDAHKFAGAVNGQPAETFPEPVTLAMLQRGQQRFDIYCAPCHDRTGAGRGMVVQRGFPAPPSYHIDRLREAPVGHLFDVITNGFGRMADYRDQVPVADRWAIVAHIRALQLSQHASRDLLSPNDLKQLAQAPGDANSSSREASADTAPDSQTTSE